MSGFYITKCFSLSWKNKKTVDEKLQSLKFRLWKIYKTIYFSCTIQDTDLVLIMQNFWGSLEPTQTGNKFQLRASSAKLKKTKYKHQAPICILH